MRPILFSLGDVSVPSYGAVYLLAFLASIFMAAYLANHGGVPFWRFVDLGFIVAIGGEVGSRLTFLIVEWDRIVAGSISLKQFLLAGRVVLGGVAVGTAVLVWQVWRKRIPVAMGTDAGLTGVSLGMAIGRLGCLLAGCCYGKPTDWWWGITFTDELARRYNGTPLGVALHPTQILQAAEGFVVFGILFWAFFRRRFDGQVSGLFWILLGLTRFPAEFLRGDPRGQLAVLSTSQWISLAGIAGGALWLWYASRLPALARRPATASAGSPR